MTKMKITQNLNSAHLTLIVTLMLMMPTVNSLATYTAKTRPILFDIGQVTLNTTLKLTIRLPNPQASFPTRTVDVGLRQTTSTSTAISTSMPSSMDIADSQDYVFEGAVTEAGIKGASLSIQQD